MEDIQLLPFVVVFHNPPEGEPTQITSLSGPIYYSGMTRAGSFYYDVFKSASDAFTAKIDLATGKTTAAVHRSDVVSTHPDTGKPVTGISVPYWERVLLMAAVSVEMTGLGYLGMDLAIDRDQGPLLLELNARPGLAIQIANQSGLRARLEKVDKAPPEIFVTPESRVEWAQNEFRV